MCSPFWLYNIPGWNILVISMCLSLKMCKTSQKWKFHSNVVKLHTVQLAHQPSLVWNVPNKTKSSLSKINNIWGTVQHQTSRSKWASSFWRTLEDATIARLILQCRHLVTEYWTRQPLRLFSHSQFAYLPPCMDRSKQSLARPLPENPVGQEICRLPISHITHTHLS